MAEQTYPQHRSPAIALTAITLAASVVGGVVGGAVVGRAVGDGVQEGVIERLRAADAHDAAVLRSAQDWERRYRQMYPEDLRLPSNRTP